MDLLRGFGVPFLAFTISLLVTFFICWYAHNEVNQKAQEKFVNEVKETQSLIKNRLESYVNALYGAQGLFAASKTVGRDEWSAYVSGIEITERYPGISLMAFIERVTAENKAAFVESVRSDTTIIPYGHPDFEIYPEGRREEYFVVKYVEPQTGNTKSLGFDIGSDPVRLTALKRARNTGEPTATGRIMPATETGNREPGFLLLLPVYRNGAPRFTVEERQAALIGFVASLFKAEDLLSGIFNLKSLHPYIDFEVFDGGGLTPEYLLHDDDHVLHAVDPGYQPRFSTSARLEVAGRIWTLYFTTRPGFGLDNAQEQLPLILLSGGLVFSFLLFGILYSLTTSRYRAVKLAETMTSDLRKSEATNRALLNAIPDSMFRISKDGVFIDFKAEKDNNLSVPPGEVVGKNMYEILPTEVAQQTLHHVEKALQTNDTQLFEYRLLLNDKIHSYESRIVVSSEDEVLAIVRDITERKRVEERLRLQSTALESAANAIVITDSAGHITWVNPSFTHLTGYTLEEVIGRNLRILKSGKQEQSFYQNLWDTILSGQVWHGEIINKRKDNSLYIEEQTITPVRDESGEINYFIGIKQDITERKKIEEALSKARDELEIRVQERTLELTKANQALQTEVSERKRAEESLIRLAIAIENAGDAIEITDDEGKIEYVNPAFEKITGYERSEVLGKTPASLLRSGEHDERLYEEIWNAISSGHMWSGSYTGKRKDGSLYYQDVTISPVRDSKNMITNYVAVRRDTTERKRAEEALRRARDELEVRVQERTLELTKTNEALQVEITERKRAEAKLEELVVQLEKSRDDMLLILNQLRLGTVMTDKDSCITFLSQAAERLFGKSQEDAIGKKWEQVFPLQEQYREQLGAMFNSPPNQRSKVHVHTEATGGRYHWMEIEVQDDPRAPHRKILFLYDVTEVHDLRLLLKEKAHFHDLVGKSKVMQVVYQQIKDLAEVDSTVLIEGETGTGKELVARAIHSSSHRKDNPFITVNCAGLTESLLGSQLFGHKKGAFTGAISDQQGLFEAANGGTIFLDEIGDIPASVQTSLLRVLQEKEITRLGETRPRKIDVRILAATHRNLNQEVERGNFRADLLYRIRVVRIQLPALHERREDIPVLVASFLGQFSAATGKFIQDVSGEAMDFLLEYPWPGNVRELRSAMEFAVIRCKGSVIQAENLPSEIISSEYTRLPNGNAYKDERQRIVDALKRAGGNRSVAARLLGIGRTTLYRRLAELGIQSDE